MSSFGITFSFSFFLLIHCIYGAFVPPALFSHLQEQSRSQEDSCHDESTERPNILLIMLDDLGFGDISATTGQFPTPNMDHLYTNGVQLSSHYVHLMCSPSRTQFITGRYAMNLGFGEFFPWNNLEIGGIPIGQPTLANWLSEYGDYTTYAVGKWHMGYANDQLAPKFNGFHHFFGFYQGAIDYITKVYNDIEEGALPIYDFFEDEEACYDVIDTEENTMDLYSSKIREYLDTEGQKVQSAKRKDEIASPFFLMATLQSMHAPFPVIRDYADECKERIAISADTLSEEYQEWRQLYCELTLITDRVVGEIMDGLKSNDLYDNTLIIFTADNGGETDNGASNYPFRGTKGEFYEGNTRVITSISGGIIESAGLAGTVRDELFSNLDWTPTLLQFAGYLQCIDPRDYTWDGRNQYDLIMNTPDYDSMTERTSLILNIGDVRLKSARIILEHEGKRYKYLKSDNESALDRWIYSGRLSDVWTIPDYEYTTELAGGMSLPALKVIEYDENDQDLMFSQHYHDAFLFDLSEDPSELYNLLHPKLGHFDEDLNTEIVSKCEQLLAQWMDDNVDELFSPPMDFLHKRLRDEGDPKKLGDGKFVRSFLSDHQYKDYITTMFEEEHNYIPQKLQDLYLTPWVVPERMLKAQSLSEAFSSSNIGNSISELQMSVLIPVAVALGVIMVALCFVGIYFCRRKKIAEDSFEESMIREAILIQNGLSEGTRNYKYQSVNRQVL